MNYYIKPDGTGYYSDMSLSGADIQVSPPPANDYTYNFETSEWEPSKEQEVFERDLTIAEAEELYKEAENGSMAAQLLIRWEDL